MEQVSLSDTREDISEASAIAALLRRFFPLYCLIAALVTFGYARYDSYQLDGDAVAYMDIGDNLRAHRWSGIVDGYWHPMYPAFLSLGHFLFRATLSTELQAYYFVNFGIFLLEMVAVVCFTDSMVRLRDVMSESASQRVGGSAGYLLDKITLRYLGLALLVIASQRELSMGKVRPDALLQAFLLFAVAALLMHLATNRLRYAALMGVALGCAYLTKSFAFLFAFVCIFALAVFRWLWLRHRPARVVAPALTGLLCFAVVAGPYVAALSRQKGRFDFGDSGALNYAWYVGGTEKMHLQPYMTSQFGSAEVHLKHPEKELLRSPQVLSYAEMAYGTYPDWFDTTYWNEQIKPHFTLRGEVSRGARNLVLVMRYLFNHPEGWLLLALLVALGARLRIGWRFRQAGTNAFWVVPLLLGVAIWGIYGTVNTEERYVTVAYFNILLALFAMLGVRARDGQYRVGRDTSAALVLLLALLSAGESLRVVLEMRRQLPEAHREGWYNAEVFDAAKGLRDLGVRPGDAVACIGSRACLDYQYIERLDGARVLTEVYAPETPVQEFLAGLPNREQVIDVVRAQGAKVLIGNFGEARVSDADPAFRDWRQLGGSEFYALPLK
jgi:hypothetical protein